jgi:hypothetical protein
MGDRRMMVDTAGPNNSFNYKGQKGARSLISCPFVFLDVALTLRAAREARAGVQSDLDLFRNPEAAGLAVEGPYNHDSFQQSQPLRISRREGSLPFGIAQGRDFRRSSFVSFVVDS